MQAATALTEEQISEITAAIRRTADPVEIVLFGSQATGNVDGDSDVDLLVVERASFSADRSRRKRIAEIRRQLPKIGVPYDVLVYASDEIERWRDARNHVISRALRDGRVLYAEGA